MKQQNYQNHKRYYWPHHFVFLPVMVILIAWGVRNWIKDTDHKLEWQLFSMLAFSILYLAIMLRQHYALGNQDRIVRLEFRLRYFQLFNTSADEIEKQLSFSQIAALRFAPDEEFKQLLNRALTEKMRGDEIKKAIGNWKADDMRL